MCHACTARSARGIGRPLPERTTMPDLSEIPGLLPRDGDPNTSRRGRLPDQMIPTDVLACFACGWWVTTARVGGILSPRSTCPNCRAHGSKPIRLAPATITVTRKDPS